MRKNRQWSHRKSSLTSVMLRAHWSVSFILSAYLVIFFWLVAANLHLPGAQTNQLIWSIDDALHDNTLLILAGLMSLIGGLLISGLSWRYGRSRKGLLDRQRRLYDLSAMTWQEFECLVAECFRRQGYRVSETGQGGADGGVDLILRRGSELILIQCKQWRKTSIGAPVVREMFGLMVHHEADRVKIVCCGKFTREAITFAQGKPVDLVNGEALLSLVISVQKMK